MYVCVSGMATAVGFGVCACVRSFVVSLGSGAREPSRGRDKRVLRRRLRDSGVLLLARVYRYRCVS